jgi:hypothetical protein
MAFQCIKSITCVSPIITTIPEIIKTTATIAGFLSFPIHVLAAPHQLQEGNWDLVLWHPHEMNDPEAQIIVSCCTNIIVICPPLSIPPHQQRLGGRYHHPWLKPCPSFPPDTFIALMPLSEEDMAIIIQGKIARSSQT